MSTIGRRQFCATLGAGTVALAGVLAGCSSTNGGTASAPPASAGTAGALAGLSFAVRRDPG